MSSDCCMATIYLDAEYIVAKNTQYDDYSSNK